MKENDLWITSPAFDDGGFIPSRFCCGGGENSPAFHIEKLPEGTQSLALIAEDTDTPAGTFDHWVVWNIPPATVIGENSRPGISGSNSTGKTGYHGPCPPDGVHRYYFHIYALDTELDLPAGSGKADLLRAMEGHILAEGSMLGRYGWNE